MSRFDCFYDELPTLGTLVEVAKAAEWLEEAHRLYCQFYPGMWVDENIIWMEWEEECGEPEGIEIAMQKIREQRAARELKEITLQAWKDLQEALRRAGVEI